MIPKQIKILEKTKLQISWEDDSRTVINFHYLRDECPCAGCKGETILFKTYRPAKPAANNPNKYELKNIQAVGNYAVQLTWGDGHNTGIYTWDYLLELDKTQNEQGHHNYNDLI